MRKSLAAADAAKARADAGLATIAMCEVAASELLKEAASHLEAIRSSLAAGGKEILH